MAFTCITGKENNIGHCPPDCRAICPMGLTGKRTELSTTDGNNCPRHEQLVAGQRFETYSPFERSGLTQTS